MIPFRRSRLTAGTGAALPVGGRRLPPRRRTALASLIAGLTFAAPWVGTPLGAQHATPFVARCASQGCRCAHAPGHAASCPCCTQSGAGEDGAARVVACVCGHEGDPANGPAPQSEGVLASLPASVPYQHAGAVAEDNDAHGPERPADSPDPVPRFLS